MERVVKRYLMHNQGDIDDQRQNDFDEFKLDLQQIKYEIMNDLKKTREDNSRNMYIINNGIQVLAEELLQNKFNNTKEKDKNHDSTNLLKIVEQEKSINKLKDFVSLNQIQVRSSSITIDLSKLNSKNVCCQNELIETKDKMEATNTKPGNNSREFIDNLNSTKPPVKVNFDLNDGKFFSPNLSRIQEESYSEKSDYLSDYTSSVKTPL